MFRFVINSIGMHGSYTIMESSFYWGSNFQISTLFEFEPSVYQTVILFAAADFLGEKLAWFFGITAPKYQYIIDEYHKMKEEVILNLWLWIRSLCLLIYVY